MEIHISASLHHIVIFSLVLKHIYVKLTNDIISLSFQSWLKYVLKTRALPHISGNSNEKGIHEEQIQQDQIETSESDRTQIAASLHNTAN